MRINSRQTDANRKAIIAAAEKLFRARGFEGVSVAEFMRAAGLTHGGFYNHFESKAELEAEAVRHACCRAVDRVKTLAEAPTAEREAEVAAYVDNYLSEKTRDAKAAHCPSIAYGGIAPRGGKEVGAAFADGLDAYLSTFAEALARDDDPDGEARRRAIQLFSTMVGALYLARATAGANKALSDEILAAARHRPPTA